MSNNRIIVDFNVLVGQTIRTIEKIYDNCDYVTELIFTTTSDRIYKMYHQTECEEWVYLADIVGELDDLFDNPVLSAYSTSNKEEDRDATWTFYNISTVKGSVTLRWFGESNGYYSEDVDFEQIPPIIIGA